MDTDWQKFLDMWGGDGWELVSTHTDEKSELWYFFKKPA